MTVPHSHIHHKGEHHKVNEHWHKEHTEPFPHFAAHSREELEAHKDKLLALSNERPLTESELTELIATVEHFNVRTSIDLAGGRHHSEFGFTGADQLHFNRWGPFACGCVLQVCFDHHKRREHTKDLHPHTALIACDKHKHLHHDPVAHHEQVKADHNAEG